MDLNKLADEAAPQFRATLQQIFDEAHAAPAAEAPLPSQGAQPQQPGQVGNVADPSQLVHAEPGAKMAPEAQAMQRMDFAMPRVGGAISDAIARNILRSALKIVVAALSSKVLPILVPVDQFYQKAVVELGKILPDFAYLPVLELIGVDLHRFLAWIQSGGTSDFPLSQQDWADLVNALHAKGVEVPQEVLVLTGESVQF